MAVVGIDVGSRRIKLVALDPHSDGVAASERIETTFDPLAQCERILRGYRGHRIVSTGYGRKLVQKNFAAETITEIQAHALGAYRLFPNVRSVLDIGGQDTKAIAVDGHGKVKKFEMNDRCAAGTGKFLELMAVSFQMPIEQFGDFALEGSPGLSINSMCTVFAESEATSLMARGHRPADIALALHLSVVKRSLSMLNRVAVEGPMVFSGGVAANRCMVHLLKEAASEPVLVPDEPDMVGALGAALYAASHN